MHWIDLIAGVFGGGVLTTVFTRLLPSTDKKVDLVSETQKDLLTRLERLENRLDQEQEKYIQLLKSTNDREKELLHEIAQLKTKLDIFSEKLMKYENRTNEH